MISKINRSQEKKEVREKLKEETQQIKKMLGQVQAEQMTFRNPLIFVKNYVQ